jgi:cyanate permease
MQHHSATMWWITYLNVIGMVCFAVFCPFSVWVIEKYGIRSSLILAMLIQCIGSLIRSLDHFNFWYLVVGQTIASIQMPIVINMITKFSANWFPKEERVVSTTICMMFN